MRAHPIAELFPMIDDGGLDELAADIKANGQRLPILRNAAGLIVDGRNRFEACTRAGIEPRFELVETDDVLGLVVSLNVKRRNLRPAQKAILAAEAWAIAEANGQVREGGRGGDRRSINAQNGHWIDNPRDHFARLFGVGKNYVDQARAILADDPIAAASIKAGTADLTLQQAYDAILKRRGDAADDASKMRRLDLMAPDLAEAVAENRKTLTAALDELATRQRLEREAREAATRLMSSALAALDPGELDAEQWAARSIAKVDTTLSTDLRPRWKPAFVRRIAECLVTLAIQMEWEKGNGAERSPKQ